jgi:hypothetical protein
MKKINFSSIVFLVFMSLSIHSFGEPQCTLPENTVLQKAASALDDKEWPESTSMILLPHHTKAKIRWGNSKKKYRQYYDIEGFALLGDKKYRLVPGLGLGFRSDEKTLVYYCMEFSERSDLKAKLIFLRRGFWTGDVKLSPVDLEILIAGEAGLLMGAIMQGAGVPGINEPQLLLSEFDRLSNFFFKRILSLGAAKVVLENSELTIYPKAKVVGVDLGFSPPIKIPYTYK